MNMFTAQAYLTWATEQETSRYTLHIINYSYW